LSSYYPFSSQNKHLRDGECNIMKVKTLSLGPIGTNCYIVSKQDQCLIFDPGAQPEVIIQYVSENNLNPLAILLTHAHFDHIGAVDAIRKEYDIGVYLHEAEHDWLEKPELNRSVLFFGEAGAVRTAKPDKLINIGPYEIGSFTFEAVHTPGHSPGSVSFIFHDESVVISGDTLFNQGIGRTDLPEGSFTLLMQSIFNQLYTLADHFVVYPGHGPSTTIGSEKYSNPFTIQVNQGK